MNPPPHTAHAQGLGTADCAPHPRDDRGVNSRHGCSKVPSVRLRGALSRLALSGSAPPAGRPARTCWAAES
jgi:hypothetical protein